MTQRLLADPKCERCGGDGTVLVVGSDGESEKDNCDCFAMRSEGWEPRSPYSSQPRVWWSAAASTACCADPQVRGGCCENCGTWLESGSGLPQGDNEG